jgi:enoyl-[acyl-carrier protein] reductase I
MPDDRTLSAAPDASGGGASGAPATHTPSKAGDLPAVARLMDGKRGLIMGVANDRSIAWVSPRPCTPLAPSSPSPTRAPPGKRVLPMVEKLARRSSMKPTSRTRRARWAVRAPEDRGRIDFVVHAIAFSDKEELKGRYVDTTRANFQRSLTISCYSFTEIARRALPLMTEGGSLDHAHLRRRHAGDAVLQRDGSGQGSPRGQRALSRGRPRPPGRGSTRFPPARCARSPAR